MTTSRNIINLILRKTSDFHLLNADFANIPEQKANIHIPSDTLEWEPRPESISVHSQKMSMHHFNLNLSQ